MAQSILLSMDKDKATIAENVVTYQRTDVEKQYQVLLKQMEEDQRVLPQLRKELEQVEARVRVNGYTLDLFATLLNKFNSDYPISAQPASADKAAKKDKKADCSDCKSADTCEGDGSLCETKDEIKVDDSGAEDSSVSQEEDVTASSEDSVADEDLKEESTEGDSEA